MMNPWRKRSRCRRVKCGDCSRLFRRCCLWMLRITQTIHNTNCSHYD
ncbi:hypothetical protein GQ600_16374 [Phytophthora cactorum]|nr:hypothetical protein GQ600_16374 [Phytophthora cactorum]